MMQQPTDTLSHAKTTAAAPTDYCTDFPAADQLRLRFDRHAPQPAPRYRDVTAATLYGGQSTLVPPPTGAADRQPLTGNALFQGFVLLVAVAYVLLVYHNLNDLRTLLNHVFRNSSSDKRSFQEPTGSRYARLLYTTTGIGLFLIGILVVKYSPPAVADLLFGRLSFAAALALCLAVAAACGLVLLVQWALLHLAGYLTLTQPLLNQLRQLRTRYFASAVVIVTPALLLYALTPQPAGRMWFVLIIIGLTVTLFLYLRETLTLFLAKKVSFIHWFLYLCTIELFPVSLLWQLAVRGGL